MEGIQGGLFSEHPTATDLVRYLFPKRLEKRLVKPDKIVFLFHGLPPVYVRPATGKVAGQHGVVISRYNWLGKCVFSRFYDSVEFA